MIRIRGDFNGCMGDHYLCLSHGDHALGEHGDRLELSEGMHALVFELDSLPTEPPEYMVVTGLVVRSPVEVFSGTGSQWALRIDEKGLRRVASLDDV